MRYLTAEEILLIHEFQLNNYGGKSGLRSLELLESAVYRPQTTFAGEEKYQSAFEKAASLMQALIKNHPFIDGNKRTGVVAGLVFLELNGFELEIDNASLVELALKIAKDNASARMIADCLKEKTQD